MQKSNYSPPTKERWKGRQTPPGSEKDYWFQCIELQDLREPIVRENAAHIALIGYACEEGVKRNQGRPGAGSGPDEARKHMARLANHLGEKRIADVGNIICPAGDMEGTQKTFSFAISELLKSGVFPIAIGGGHDIAYGHFNGVRSAVNGTIGIINFDAHFDLRKPINGPNSGTPFYQILTENEGTGYLAIGIQRSANPPSLFNTADAYRADYVLNFHCCINSDFRRAVIDRINVFAAAFDHLYVTIDMDGFSSAVAPGVSAPSPMGYYPPFFFPALTATLASGKVACIDIAEYNPVYDQDGMTGKLVANIVDTIVSGVPVTEQA